MELDDTLRPKKRGRPRIQNEESFFYDFPRFENFPYEKFINKYKTIFKVNHEILSELNKCIFKSKFILNFLCYREKAKIFFDFFQHEQFAVFEANLLFLWESEKSVKNKSILCKAIKKQKIENYYNQIYHRHKISIHERNKIILEKYFIEKSSKSEILKSFYIDKKELNKIIKKFKMLKINGIQEFEKSKSKIGKKLQKLILKKNDDDDNESTGSLITL